MTANTARNRRFFAVGLLLALLVAGVVSFYASSAPDGLNKVAADKGLADKQRSSATDGSPLAGYETKGVEHPRLSGGLAGVVGVGITLLVGGGLFWFLARSRRDQQSTGTDLADDGPRGDGRADRSVGARE